MQTQQQSPNSRWDFPVALQEVFTSTGQRVPKVRAVVRTDENQPIAAVSDRYRLFTHREVQDTINPFVEALGTPTSKYFVERGGARLIAEHTFKDVMLDMPGHGAERTVGDKVALRINVINSYNSTTSLQIKMGAMVLKCLNGMSVFDELFDVRFRHLGDDWAVQLPKPDLVMTAFREASKTWDTWAHLELDDQMRSNIVESANRLHLVSKRSFDSLRWHFDQAKTAWDLYNAFTYAITHGSNRVQQTGRLNRYDRLNLVFAHELEREVA